MSHHPLIKPGDTDSQVSRVKKLTKRHLIKMNSKALADKISSSDHYGASAVVGVKQVQTKYGLMADGIVGPKTWKVLEYARTKKRTRYPFVVVPRANWAARTPKGISFSKWASNGPVRVHHTVTDAPRDGWLKFWSKDLANAEKEHMRQIQAYHMDKRGYWDIGYNYVIFPSGRIYEGRGKEVSGAHTLGHNDDPGVAFAGNYETDTFTYAQWLAYRRLKMKLGIKGRDVAHRATYATACPGKNVISALKLVV